MSITAALVNELRQKTGAGMMDCKKALTESNGDIEKAIEILRKKGASVAAKRADKAANEGIVLTKISDDKHSGYILEINCETDFVAKSDDFQLFVNNAIASAISNNAATVEELLSDSSIKNQYNELLGKVGEKIVISRLAVLKSENGMIIDYIHPGSKLGVLVCFDNLSSDKFEDFYSIAKDISMQVAAMKPISVYREDVSKEIVDKEIEIYKEISRKEGKPENILEKIAIGRLNKFYQENCLLEQAYIKDNSKVLGDLVKEFNSKNSSQVKVKSFLRFHLGDEKK
jgi:elongation factor Ts